MNAAPVTERPSWFRRFGWFVLIWALSVWALGIVAALFRILMKFAGMTLV